MEVSAAIAAETKANSPSVKSQNTTTTASTINPANNISPLFSNDNLQSQAQKSQTVSANISSKKPATGEKIISNNNNNNSHGNTSSRTASESNNQEPGDQSSNKALKGPLLNTNYTEQSSCHQTDDTDISEEALLRNVKLTLETILSNVISGLDFIATATSSQSSFICAGDGSCTTTAVIKPIIEDVDDRTKDIVTLRNLEITPPPQSEGSIETPEPPQLRTESRSSVKRKGSRSLSESTEQSEGSMSGRGKRQRTQTKLFQLEVKETARSKSVSKESVSTRKSLASTKKTPAKEKPNLLNQHQQQAPMSQDFQDVIFYEKNDYLAIRNEENTFYLCQLTEHVRIPRPTVKVKWLDTNDNGKTYFATSHYDKVPQKSIIMPVTLKKLRNEKKGPQIYVLDDVIKESVMERLKRSLNVPPVE